jgi:hypothetical protein
MYWKIWPTKLDRSACLFGLSATSTFLSEQTSHQQSASSTFLSKQISTSRQPPAKRTGCKLTACEVRSAEFQVLNIGHNALPAN